MLLPTVSGISCPIFNIIQLKFNKTITVDVEVQSKLIVEHSELPVFIIVCELIDEKMYFIRNL